jgi:glycosyltransferase involved in cell wall biosynthesis
MFCSIIIPTVGRESLNRAAKSALAQEFAADEFEIIVVNDSGKPLPEAGWHVHPQVRFVETQKRERSVARNTGAAIARGEFFNFLDDDDWLMPNALRHLKRCVDEGAGADWYYGITTLVNKANMPRAELALDLKGNCFAQLMAGEWIPLQASVIRAGAFFNVGGFRTGIDGAEDTTLGRWLTLRGDVAACPHVVACIRMRAPTSTTDYKRTPDLARRAREEILNQPGVWARMSASAGDGYWAGRMVRVYFTSFGWNLKHGNFFAGAHRLAWGAAAALWSMRYWGSRGYWGALRSHHESSNYARRSAGEQNWGYVPRAAAPINGNGRENNGVAQEAEREDGLKV